MPQVFKIGSYWVYFWTNENLPLEPVHVHISEGKPVRIHFNRTRFFEPSNTLMCNYTAFVKDSGQLDINDEIDSYAWFSPDEAGQNIKKNSLAAFFLNTFLSFLK